MSTTVLNNGIFTYLPEETSNSALLCNNDNIENIDLYGHYLSTDQTGFITPADPVINVMNTVNTIIPANTETTLCEFNNSANVAIVTLHIPLKVNDFKTLTSSDSFIITVNDFTETVKFMHQPITLFNKSIQFKKIENITVKVKSSVDCEYQQSTNQVVTI